MVRVSADRSSPSEDFSLPRKSQQSKEAPEPTRLRASSKKKMSLKSTLTAPSERLTLDKLAENLSMTSRGTKSLSSGENFPSLPVPKPAKRNDSAPYLNPYFL